METIPAELFKWSDGFGVANFSDLGLRGYGINSLHLKSPKTGKTLKFELDQEEAINNECWDGEFQILRSTDKKLAIKVWNY